LTVLPANALNFIEDMMEVVKFDVMELIWRWNDYAFWGEDRSLVPNVPH